MPQALASGPFNANLGEGMSEQIAKSVSLAEVVLPCADLDACLAFYAERLGFRIEAIFPADSPRVAVLSGYGLRIRLQRDADQSPGEIRLTCRHDDHTRELVAPNGTRITFVGPIDAVPAVAIEPSIVMSRALDHGGFATGRAGMQYRDLIAGRLGGGLIASHIRIVDGGPVPDYVHYHHVRFQMIYCYQGWVRVVYEDQGPPFTMHAGDCVLQPPGIRHRVLESSAGLEVIEIGAPAEHMTRVDHDLELPTKNLRADRDFGGQRFVFHNAAEADWQAWRAAGFEYRDTGIATATSRVAGVRVVRVNGSPEPVTFSHQSDVLFMFVLQGSLTLTLSESGDHDLCAGDAACIPAEHTLALQDCSNDLEWLEVTLPAAVL